MNLLNNFFILCLLKMKADQIIYQLLINQIIKNEEILENIPASAATIDINSEDIDV